MRGGAAARWWCCTAPTTGSCPIAIGERLAELTGGELIELEGAGHGPPAREPVLVNTEIRAFVERVWPPQIPPRRGAGPGRWSRRPRVLYLSSPIGLGHARRDVAIAAALRTPASGGPDRLAGPGPGDPGARRPPASGSIPPRRWLANESAHIEAEALDHDLHAFRAIRRMDEILINNFMVFDDVVADEPYDLVIGDEAWDVDYFLHENPERKRFAYAWFTDFVGLAADARRRRVPRRALTADYNAEMLEQRARLPAAAGPLDLRRQPRRHRRRTPSGRACRAIRDWTERELRLRRVRHRLRADRRRRPARLRARHGYRDDERVCVVSVGGSGVGAPLLRRVLDAVPLVRRRAPDLRFLVVAGPRIDPGRCRAAAAPRCVGYLPDLLEHLIACDAAVVQGGLSTCMELTAARRPFLYVPLRNHFEQNLHVRHRLDRYRAGRCLPYEQACDPDVLADALLATLGQSVDYLPVATDGADRAARTPR